MSLIKHLTTLSEHFNDPISRWMVQHGQSFQINPFTFSGERMEQGNCYENALVDEGPVNQRTIMGNVPCMIDRDAIDRHLALDIVNILWGRDRTER